MNLRNWLTATASAAAFVMLGGLATPVMATPAIAPASDQLVVPIADTVTDTHEVIEQGSAKVYRKSFKCGSKQLNVSWALGNVSVTIYFNNHCTTKKNIQTWWVNGNTGKTFKGTCFTVNPETKGRKKLGSVTHTLKTVNSPKKC